MTRALYALLAAVAVAAAVLSFDALRGLALLCGFAPGLSWLLPVVVDAGAAAGSLVWLGGRAPDRARQFARVLALVLLGSSVAANALSHGLAAYGARPAWWVVVLVSGVAPAVLGACVHLAVLVGTGAAQPDELADASDTAGVPVVRRAPRATGATTLYRLFNAEDELLYVGITGTSLARRLGTHRRTQPWWDEVAETTVEIFDDRVSALAAEREIIEAEKPRYNKMSGSLDDSCTAGAPTPAVLHVVPPDPNNPGDRAAALIAAGVGRRVLSRELGISEHEARLLLEERKSGAASG